MTNVCAQESDIFISRDGTAAEAEAICVTDLRKSFGSIQAIDGISFSVRRGEIFGFIGADGSGKTSLFNILAGILNPTDGDVEVLQQPPSRARFHVGYLTQRFSLNLELSVMENIEYVGGLRKVSADQIASRAKRYLELMGMLRFSGRLAANLSGGMKQKLALCCSLISRPQLLLLDEPTTGVDPVSRREFWDILTQIRNEGITIAVATPYMDEAERCTRVALFDEGKIMRIGTPSELCAQIQLKRLIVRAKDVIFLSRNLQECKHAPFSDVQLFGDHIDVLCRETNCASECISNCARVSQICDLSISPTTPSLSNVFELSQSHRTERQTRYNPFRFIARASPGTDIAIAAKRLEKRFGNFRAVKQLDLEVKYGEIYGLLGANGAGKTTCIKMLCGLSTPTSGDILFGGEHKNLRDKSIRREIGYMSQKFTLYEDLSLIENLRFYCGIYQIPPRLRQERIDWVLETAGLKGHENLLTRELPGGWKQRLALGTAVLHQPSVLFLDEPTSGVDPVARRQMWRMISDFASNGTAVLITTHFLEEAEYCHQLGLMVDGEMEASGSPQDLKMSQPGVLLQLEVDKVQLLYDLLRKRFAPWRTSIFGGTLHMVLDHPEQEISIIKAVAAEQGVTIETCNQIPFTLEDAFIGIVMRKQRQP